MANVIWPGLAAGLAGAIGIHGFRIAWDLFTGGQRRHGIYGFDQEADVNSIRAFGRILGCSGVSHDRAERLAIAAHYTYGALAGLGYGVVSRRLPARLRTRSGLAFGIALWAFGDEIPIAIAGFSDPASKSAASHLSSLTVHLIFAATVNHLLHGSNNRSRQYDRL